MNREMRRKDREITGLQNLLEVLDRCDVIRLGLCADHQPYIVPMNFGYRAEKGKVSLFLHCAPVGKKLDIIARNPKVCFEGECSYKTLGAEKACSYSAEFQSVMGEGEIVLLTDETQKISALDALMAHYGFVGKPEYSPRALAGITVLKLSVSSMTGKRRV
ncbi:MAG: pyridoxamine 5'-phosphate oxidase family protein [Peptococcaceae bacterium]|nr:pyridoxamine 5'-phosphate oxidase family protein [Peptococcaceae bacterium]